jgi:hypothetical protein
MRQGSGCTSDASSQKAVCQVSFAVLRSSPVYEKNGSGETMCHPRTSWRDAAAARYVAPDKVKACHRYTVRT